VPSSKFRAIRLSGIGSGTGLKEWPQFFRGQPNSGVEMIRPLEKTTKEGKRYDRGPQMENAIARALAEDLPTLRRRAEVRDPKSPDFLPSECMVHLIRHARRGWNNEKTSPPTVNALLPALLRRCEGNLRKHVSNDIPNAEDIRQDVLDALVDLFVVEGTAEDNNALDFYEVRFNLAFRKLRITHLNRALADINARVTLPSHLDEEEMPERDIDEELLGRLSDLVRDTPENATFRIQVLREIMTLPFEERQALILCHYLGYEEESPDLTKKTAATICKVTGRTIRNRIQRALQKLSRLKEDA